MKIAIVGDTHFGMRADSLHFHNYYKRFYQETLFPTLKEMGVTRIVQLGDLFDRRKYINYNTLYLSKNYFFDSLESNGIELVTLVGNHDIFFKNTLKVNSIELTLREYQNIHVITSPETLTIDGVSIDLIPWICEENEQEVMEFINNSNSQICMGHFELAGFEMDRGNICHEGMDRNVLAKYDVVLSGHFHHKSSSGNIHYVGTPGEMTWSDYNDKRGFHIFDTETRELTFIENPFKMFHKVVYNDDHETVDTVKSKNFNKYTNTILKVIVAKKVDPYLFEVFMDKVYKSQPHDVSVVEDFTDYTQISDEDVIDQADDTMTTLSKYVDSLQIDLDKERLKTYMREVYVEAQSRV
jgi:DNA repair exonuclease SbcCD nuclease subunit